MRRPAITTDRQGMIIIENEGILRCWHRQR
jgi:hypothetical protein